MNKYFYTDGTNKFGPFSKDELRNQKISRRTKVWFYGMDNWLELSDVPELNDLIISIPPEIKTKYISDKSNEKKSVINQIRQKLPSINKKKHTASKWFIGTIITLVVSFLIYSFIRNQSNANFYKKIIANSYESDDNFEMYVEKFYRDLEYYGVYPKKPKKTIIKFSKLDQLDNTTHIHGLSFGFEDDDKIEIYINPSTWKKFNKAMRYYLMYHELAHDVLNIDDLDAIKSNEEELMYPEISSYEDKSMDNFIESYHKLFEEYSKQ